MIDEPLTKRLVLISYLGKIDYFGSQVLVSFRENSNSIFTPYFYALGQRCDKNPIAQENEINRLWI